MTLAVLGVNKRMTNPSQRIASSAIQFFNDAEDSATRIIAALPEMEDGAVWEIRMQARTYKRMGWRVECACDAEILNRESARRGKGVKDIEERGVDAAVKKHAAEIGVSPNLIYQNAAIHKTFFNSFSAKRNNKSNGSLDDLDEKEFYRAALSTEDPHATIERFAQEKLKNPFFSTRDAWRMTKEDKTPPLDTTVPALCDDPEVVKAWEDFQSCCRSLINAAPRLQGLVNGYLEEIQYELTLPPQTVKEAIFELIRQGWDECDMIAVRMKKDRVYVTVWLNRLVELGEMESFEKERAPGARGAARTGYREI